MPRIDTISPGIVIAPLTRDEPRGPRAERYRRMIEPCPAGAPAPRTRSEQLPRCSRHPEATDNERESTGRQ